MGLGLQGAYGAGAASDFLEQLLLERARQDELARRQAMDEQDRAHRQQEFGMRQSRYAVDDQRYADTQATMKANTAAEAAEKAATAQQFESIVASAPPALQAVLRLKKQGVAGVTPHDFHPPEIEQQEREAAQAAELGEFTQKEDIKGRIGAKYREPREPRADPVVPVETIENGKRVVKYLPQSQVRGQTFEKPSTTGTMSPVLTERLASGQSSVDTLDRLTTLFKDEYVGPIAGRFNATSLKIPGMGVDPAFAEFSAETATLKNAVIKATTGAAMSEPEAQRIMQQIPSLEDKPDVWHAKARATRRNLASLEQRIRELSSGGVDSTSSSQEYDYVPGKGLVPRRPPQ